jgi:hypothetical protein
MGNPVDPDSEAFAGETARGEESAPTIVIAEPSGSDFSFSIQDGERWSINETPTVIAYGVFDEIRWFLSGTEVHSETGPVNDPSVTLDLSSLGFGPQSLVVQGLVTGGWASAELGFQVVNE